MSKCQSAVYHLRSISQIRYFLDKDATRTLIQARVISRLDYANSLLIGANKLKKRSQLIRILRLVRLLQGLYHTQQVYTNYTGCLPCCIPCAFEDITAVLSYEICS